ncbi:MAG TPA: hypothetical protein VGW40_06615 [Allosphingosinicella sp.]|nr:hypothetical protein [Allosphingosinicella sp.]
MSLSARLLLMIVLTSMPAGYLADAQVRLAPFARPPALPPTVIPAPTTPPLRPLTPLSPPPAIQPLPLPGPIFGSPPPPPPPPPPMGSQYWSVLWAELGPTTCEVEGVPLSGNACEMVDLASLLWGLRDPSRQSELLKELARNMVAKEVRVRFNAADPLEFRVQAVEAIYAALQAEFDNVLVHIERTMIEAPASSLIQRAYAIADAVAVEDLRIRVAAESRQNMAATVEEVNSDPERESVNLFHEGLAFRQAVAGSMGRNVFDSY